MKSTKFISTYVFAFLLLCFSCQKDDGDSGGEQQENIPDTFSQYFGNEISRDFLGTIIDKNSLPIEGVTITIGDETTFTDSNGVFIIRDANVNERFGYVKAEKAGYIHGSRSVVPSVGTNKVNIMLLDATVIGTVNSGSAETVAMANGSSVSFDGNFIKEDGSSYSGSVDVIMHHLNPADEDMPMQMPGMLYAQNEVGAERMLQTLGMLAVELRGTNGEDLNLAEGSTSEIKIPVDASLMSIAPVTIPLWYFDEVKGYWKEEGQATLQGNMYVGTVSHFSFWNCDIPAEAITLCATVTDVDGHLLSNLQIALTSSSFGTTYGVTNENGEVCGLIAANDALDMNIYNILDCFGSSIYSNVIGPFSEDTSINVIINNIPDVSVENIQGAFNQCDGNPVMNGYVTLHYSSLTFIDYVKDGNFEINVLRCPELNFFSIKATDIDNMQSTEGINYSFMPIKTQLGALTACNTINEFIQFTVNDSQSFIITNGFYSRFVEQYQPYNNEPALFISGYEAGNDISLTGILNPQAHIDSYGFSSYYSVLPGFYSNASLNGISYYNNHDNYIQDQSFFDNQYFNLNKLGDIGEYIDMNFQFNAIDPQGNYATVKGIIHVLREL